MTVICGDKQFLWSPARRNVSGSSSAFTAAGLVFRPQRAGTTCVFKRIIQIFTIIPKIASFPYTVIGFWTVGQCEKSGVSHGLLWHRSRDLQTKTSWFAVILFTVQSSSRVRRYSTTSSFMDCVRPPGPCWEQPRLSVAALACRCLASSLKAIKMSG